MNRNDPNYFSDEYRRRISPSNPTWMALRAVTFGLTWGRDTLFPFARARELDHLDYRSLGREIPLLDVVPLSSTTHRIVTHLRDCGLRGPVNVALRGAGLVWLGIDFGLPTVLVMVATGHGSLLGSAVHSVIAAAHDLSGHLAAIRDLTR